MLRRLNLLNILGDLINPASHDAQIDGSQATKIVDVSGNTIGSISTESGRSIPVYQANRADGGAIHFHVNNLGVGTYLFVLVDISDTDNYNHTLTNYAHLEYCNFSAICDVNGEFVAQAAFIEEVTETGAQEYVWDHWQGAKDTGNTFNDPNFLFPVGPELTSNKFTTHQSGQSTNWQSDVLLPSTLTPLTPGVYPGDGDIVLKIVVTAGNIKALKINMGYHSH